MVKETGQKEIRPRKKEPVQREQLKKEGQIKNNVRKRKYPAKTGVKKEDNNLNKFEFKKEKIKIIHLGGIQEIGKNITVNNSAVKKFELISFITYLERNKEKIKGLVITHGHEDHIGAIPYLLKQIDIPIYATKLTAGLIENKLKEHRLVKKTRLKIVNQGQTISVGKFKV